MVESVIYKRISYLLRCIGNIQIAIAILSAYALIARVIVQGGWQTFFAEYSLIVGRDQLCIYVISNCGRIIFLLSAGISIKMLCDSPNESNRLLFNIGVFLLVINNIPLIYDILAEGSALLIIVKYCSEQLLPVGIVLCCFYRRKSLKWKVIGVSYGQSLPCTAAGRSH